MINDTIVAISTALGQGAISIVRLSGDEAIDIANRIFVGKDLTTVSSHTVHYGHIQYKKKTIDEVEQEEKKTDVQEFETMRKEMSVLRGKDQISLEQEIEEMIGLKTVIRDKR